MKGSELTRVLTDALCENRITYGGRVLDAEAGERLADLSAATGVAAREPIGVSCENGPDAVAAYFAAASIDAVAAPLPPTVDKERRRTLWRSVGCRFAIEGDAFVALEKQDEPIDYPECIDWILFSSGSTGEPKAIAASLGQMRRNAEATVETLGLNENILHLGCMSQCYTNGLFNSFILPLVTSGRCELAPVVTGLSVRRFAGIIESVSPSVLWLNPTVIQLLMRFAEPASLSTTDYVISCTAPLEHSLAIKAEQTFGCPVLQSYGLSETLIVTLERPERDTMNEFSAGVPIGGSSDVSIGVDDRLSIHNGAVTPGYITVENGAVQLALPEGCPGQQFLSQDAARWAGDERLMITGRSDHVLNIGGLKLGAEQLEAALVAHDSVEAAVVVPVADGKFGERPVALIKARAAVPETELEKVCVDRFGPFARPSNIFFVDALPLTANGKIDRRAADHAVTSRLARLSQR